MVRWPLRARLALLRAAPLAGRLFHRRKSIDQCIGPGQGKQDKRESSSWETLSIGAGGKSNIQHSVNGICHPQTSAERIEKIRHNLLKYCKHDTVAMVRLVGLVGFLPAFKFAPGEHLIYQPVGAR